MSVIQSIDWAVLAPPVTVAVTAVAVLIADLFLPAHRKRLLGGIAITGLGLAALALLPLRAGDRATFCLADNPGLCAYGVDTFTLVLQLLVIGGALLAALLSLPDLRPGPDEDGSLPRGEFWFLLLASASGAALLPAARDLATLVLALEVTTLPAYALVALRRGDRTGPQAALTFFLSSVTATAVMLLGLSFVYAGAGSLFLPEIASALPQADPELDRLVESGVVLALVGFAFKTSVVPFHFWVPDTYAGAPLPVAAYLAVVGKVAGLAGLVLVTSGAFPAFGHLWGPLLAVLAGLTLTVGTVAALRVEPDAPHSAIRLLAWSSVGQAGFLLVPVAAAGQATGLEETSVAVGAAVAYALMYAVATLGTFAVVAAVARGRTAHRIAEYRGLATRQPLTALALGFLLLCLAGLPPGVIGLFAKVVVFRSAIDAGFGMLAVVMAVNVVIGLVYYLRWTALLFRAPAPAPADGQTDVTGPAPVTGQAPERCGDGPASATVGEPATGAVGGPAAGAAVPSTPAVQETSTPAVPAPLTAVIGLTVLLAAVLSVLPQLILGFASGSLL